MFIFFDIDATLVDHEKAAEIAVARFLQSFAHVLPYSQVEFLKTWHEVADRHNDLYFQGKVSLLAQRRNRMREIFARSEPHLADTEADFRFQLYLEHYESNWKLFDCVLLCLAPLTHMRLGLISNGDMEQQRKKLKQTGLADRFSPVLISSEIGIGKPAPEIFLEADRKSVVSPEECVYVGDRLDVDVFASRAIGMEGVWLNRYKTPIPDSPVPVVSTLEELEQLLPSMGSP